MHTLTGSLATVTSRATPLHLLKRLNLLNVKDNFDQTALHWAATECDDLSILELFITKFPQALSFKDKSGETPLKASISRGLSRPSHAAIVDLLRRKTEHYLDARKVRARVSRSNEPEASH